MPSWASVEGTDGGWNRAFHLIKLLWPEDGIPPEIEPDLWGNDSDPEETDPVAPERKLIESPLTRKGKIFGQTKRQLAKLYFLGKDRNRPNVRGGDHDIHNIPQRRLLPLELSESMLNTILQWVRQCDATEISHEKRRSTERQRRLPS